MKNQNPLTKLTLLLAVLLILGLTRAQADILPGVSITFAPVGLTMDQTSRLNLVNIGVPTGMLISWSFIDANGGTVSQSSATLPFGKIVSVDYRRAGGPVPSTCEPRCEPKSTFLPLTFQARAFAEVWRYSTMIPARPWCSWAVQLPKSRCK